MATKTINVSVDVPGSYRVDKLTKQLTEYAKRLVKLSRPISKNKNKYRYESLCGIFASKASELELVEEYLQEKYKL